MTGPPSKWATIPLSIRDLLWLASYVVAGTAAYVDLAHRIDTQALKMAGVVEREAQAWAFLEGRLVEVRAQLQTVETTLAAHAALAAHAVEAERVAELQARLGKLEGDVRELRQARPDRRAAYERSHVDLPNGQRVHMLRATEPPEEPEEPPETGIARLTAPVRLAWRQVTTPLVVWWRR